MLGIMYHVKKTALQYKNIEMANSYVQNLRIKKKHFWNFSKHEIKTKIIKFCKI